MIYLIHTCITLMSTNFVLYMVWIWTIYWSCILCLILDYVFLDILVAHCCKSWSSWIVHLTQQSRSFVARGCKALHWFWKVLVGLWEVWCSSDGDEVLLGNMEFVAYPIRGNFGQLPLLGPHWCYPSNIMCNYDPICSASYPFSHTCKSYTSWCPQRLNTQSSPHQVLYYC